MAFTVEDGSVVPGANSYAAVEYALSHFADLGRAAEFDGELEDQQSWLAQGTAYIEMRFSQRFLSTPYAANQPLSFPRIGYDDFGAVVAWMPDQLLRATCEYAARAKLGPLAPDPVLDKSGQSVVMTYRRVGPIERHFAVAPGSSAGTFRSYPAADALIAPLLRPANRRVIR